MDRPAQHISCPATMHSEKCSDHYMSCPKWINVQGRHPQTGETVNRYDCADAWMPILMVENSNQQRGTQKAIESFKNEMAKDNREVLKLAQDKKLLVE